MRLTSNLALIMIVTSIAFSGAGAGHVGTTYAGTDTFDAQDGNVSVNTTSNVTVDDTVFKRVKTDNAGFVASVNLSMLSSGFQPDTTLRVVTGGSANGQRVVWFDIGIAKTNSGFATRANMSMDFPTGL